MVERSKEEQTSKGLMHSACGSESTSLYYYSPPCPDPHVTCMQYPQPIMRLDSHPPTSSNPLQPPHLPSTNGVGLRSHSPPSQLHLFNASLASPQLKGMIWQHCAFQNQRAGHYLSLPTDEARSNLITKSPTPQKRGKPNFFYLLSVSGLELRPMKLTSGTTMLWRT